MSEQLISQLCMTFDSMISSDNQVRSQAESYLKQIQTSDGIIQSLLYISTNPQEFNKGKQFDLSAQAALYLKLRVQQSWGEEQGKENFNSNNKPEHNFSMPLNYQDKEFLRQNIFKALDQASSKPIQSAFENIIFNIAECDYPENWKSAISEIEGRLKSGNELAQISGLTALKEILVAFQYQVKEERAPLNMTAEYFFPMLEHIMQNLTSTQTENQITLMHLISKIFYSANELQLTPYFMNQPQRISPWMNFFVSILETELGPQFETPTDSCQQIEALDKQQCWRLKGIVSQSLLKLFQKYTAILIENRFGTGYIVQQGQQQQNIFSQYFEMSHTSQILNCLLKIILSKLTKFVGTKTLCSALKTVQVSIKYKNTRRQIQDHINTILYEVSLPLMLLNENEFSLMTENPIEYVRMQVDQSNPFNAKQIVKTLVKSICSIKQTRGQKISNYLQNYLQVLATNLQQANDDFRVKEAIMHSLGSIKDHINASPELSHNMEGLLKEFVFGELKTDNPFLRARACWLYGQFAKLDFQDQDHLRCVLNELFTSLSNEHLPVRVESALALNSLLCHELAIDFLRPGLETLLKTYLKIMDDIDFDELVESLQQLVNVYQDEIAPYAISLCSKLGEAYLKLLQSKGSGEDEDQETSLTCDGLMTAIRRVLESISGKNYQELYPQLEEILEQPLQATFTEAGQMSVEEGITCLSELLYNQNEISMRMWNFYGIIIDLIANNRGVLDEYTHAVCVPLINFMSKNPEQFRNANFGNQGSALDMMFNLIGKIFEVAKIKEDEIEAMCAITLIMSLLENVQGIESSLHNIIEYLIKELQTAETPDYKSMISQGICISLWHNTHMTLMSLEQLGCTQNWINLLFSQLNDIKQDFEIKRFVIGLTSLIQKDQSELPPSVQEQLPGIMKALVFLCQKSIIIREKNLQKQKDEECEDENIEQAIIEDQEDDCEIMSDEDDDEDYDCNEDLDRNLYDSKFDEMDEVIFFRDAFMDLQQRLPNMYSFHLSCLDNQEHQNFEQAINKAIEYQQMIAQEQNQQN